MKITLYVSKVIDVPDKSTTYTVAQNVSGFVREIDVIDPGDADIHFKKYQIIRFVRSMGGVDKEEYNVLAFEDCFLKEYIRIFRKGNWI